MLRPRPGASADVSRAAGSAASIGTGFEVLLVKRHAASGVLGGAHVFPGGKVDAADGQIDTARLLDQSSAELVAALGEPGLADETAVAIHVAAIREAWEESGVLFVDGADGPEASAVTAAAAGEALVESQLARGFDVRLAAPGARLRTRALVPWTRWITPKQPTVTQRRFDARFFLAAVPGDIEVRIDDHEAVESLWITPAEAIECFWRRELVLAAPQIMSLVHLARHPDIAAVVADARQRGVQLVEPFVTEIDGLRTTCYPGDPLHPVTERRLPGPTRLTFRDGRFEPAGGLAALLAGDH